MASLRVAYILWFFFGFFGIHHLYLGRLNHAFVWFSTFGGGGVGWLRDFWRLPAYVKWANLDPEFSKLHSIRMSVQKYPSCSIFRLIGLFVMGFLTAIVFSSVIPSYTEDDRMNYPVCCFICRCASKILYVTGAILGVYLVANIGEIRCPIEQPIMGCLFSLPWVFVDDGNVTSSPLLSGLSTWYRGLQWRSPVPQGGSKMKNTCSNIFIFSLAAITWVSLISAGLFFNASVVVNEERIPLRVALSNFFKSELWIRTKDSLYQLYKIYRHAGWWRMYSDAKGLFDLSGEKNAYRILELSDGATQEEINKQCRQLGREYHPDKQKDPQSKAWAQEKFIEVQSACNTLSTLRLKRARSSSTSEDKHFKADFPFKKKTEF